jgi:hypothetical protein
MKTEGIKIAHPIKSSFFSLSVQPFDGELGIWRRKKTAIIDEAAIGIFILCSSIVSKYDVPGVNYHVTARMYRRFVAKLHRRQVFKITKTGIETPDLTYQKHHRQVARAVSLQ